MQSKEGDCLCQEQKEHADQQQVQVLGAYPNLSSLYRVQQHNLEFAQLQKLLVTPDPVMAQRCPAFDPALRKHGSLSWLLEQAQRLSPGTTVIQRQSLKFLNHGLKKLEIRPKAEVPKLSDMLYESYMAFKHKYSQSKKKPLILDKEEQLAISQFYDQPNFYTSHLYELDSQYNDWSKPVSCPNSKLILTAKVSTADSTLPRKSRFAVTPDESNIFIRRRALQRIERQKFNKVLSSKIIQNQRKKFQYVNQLHVSRIKKQPIKHHHSQAGFQPKVLRRKAALKYLGYQQLTSLNTSGLKSLKLLAESRESKMLAGQQAQFNKLREKLAKSSSLKLEGKVLRKSLLYEDRQARGQSKPLPSGALLLNQPQIPKSLTRKRVVKSLLL